LFDFLLQFPVAFGVFAIALLGQLSERFQKLGRLDVLLVGA
jgi:hypothetical protein